MKKSQHELALEIQKVLAALNEGSIKVVSRDPRLGLKARAAMTREFFKSIGLKGIKVTVPRGAWCLWVEIRFPCLDHDIPMHQRNARDTSGCPGCAFQAKTRLSLEEILLRAFPKEIDNSDYQTDYFDFQWTIGTY